MFPRHFAPVFLTLSVSIFAVQPTDLVAGEAGAFGFRSLEIFKLNRDAVGLTVSDLDVDGLPDIVVANNADATIELLYQRTEEEMAVEQKKNSELPSTRLSRKSKELNEIASDVRFRVEKFYTERHVVSLAVGDFNSDGKPDIAYYADPPELEVLLQSNSWGAEREKFAIRDGAESPYAVSSTDLDEDGRDDLVLLGKRKLYIAYQGAEGLKPPVALHSSSDGVWDLEFLDLNHDGRLDLVLFDPNSEQPVITRLQGAHGFGPEMTSRLRPIQSWLAPRFPIPSNAEPAPTILTIQTNTQRVKAYRWKEKTAKLGLATAQVLGLRHGGDAKNRDSTFADVDGDGRTDVVVSYPGTAELEIHFQDEDGQLTRREIYPTLAAANAVDAADLDGDGRVEIVVTSAKEKALGISGMRDGRLKFPRTWPLEAEPLLLATAPLRSDADTSSPDSVFLVSQDTATKTLELHVYTLGDDGAPTLAGRAKLASKGGTPRDIRLLDANGDGKTDFLLFVSYEDPFLYLQQSSGDPASQGEQPSAEFEDISRSSGFGIGQLSKLEPAALTVVPGSVGDVSGGPGDSLIVSAGSFVRILRLDQQNRLQVIHQLSARSASAKLSGAVVMNLSDDVGEEVVVLDTASNELDIFEQGADGRYELSGHVPTPKMDVIGLSVADLDADGRGDLIVRGKEQFALHHATSTQYGFEEALTFSLGEELDRGKPRDLAVGDLNGDAKPDLVVATVPSHNLLFMKPDDSPDREELEVALAFPIFEEKTYMRRRQDFGPREMVVADVNKDGLEDLLVLIHDRLLLYLQDVAP